MAIFTLHYRRGSFGQEQDYDSRSNAIGGAYLMIGLEGHHSFTIKEGGKIVMYHSEIAEYCQAAKAGLLRGRAPARGNNQP